MKANELIKSLEKLIKKHGNLEIMVYNTEYGGHDVISSPKVGMSEEGFTYNYKNNYVPKKIFII